MKEKFLNFIMLIRFLMISYQILKLFEKKGVAILISKIVEREKKRVERAKEAKRKFIIKWQKVEQLNYRQKRLPSFFPHKNH